MSWKNFQFVLFFEQFLIKGWEIGILLLLPLLEIQGQISLFELGLLSTSLSLAQLLASLFSGQIIKKIGTNKMMFLTAILGAFPWLIFGFKPHLFILVLIYFSSGLASGLFETGGVALIAHNLDHGKRSEGLGNLAMAGDMGRILLTACTTIFVVTWGIMSFSLVNFVIGLCLLFSLLVIFKKWHPQGVNQENYNKSSNFQTYFKDNNLVIALIVGWLDSFASASLFIFLPLLFQQKGIPYEESGILSILLFVGYMLGRKVLGKLADTIGVVKTLMFGETFMALIIIAIVFTSNFIILVFLLLLLGVATRGTSPVCKAFVADSIPENVTISQGVSIYQSGARVASIISRPLFSSMIGLAGVSSVFVLSAVSAFLINLPLQIRKAR